MGRTKATPKRRLDVGDNLDPTIVARTPSPDIGARDKRKPGEDDDVGLVLGGASEDEEAAAPRTPPKRRKRARRTVVERLRTGASAPSNGSVSPSLCCVPIMAVNAADNHPPRLVPGRAVMLGRDDAVELLHIAKVGLVVDEDDEEDDGEKPCVGIYDEAAALAAAVAAGSDGGGSSKAVAFATCVPGEEFLVGLLDITAFQFDCLAEVARKDLIALQPVASGGMGVDRDITIELLLLPGAFELVDPGASPPMTRPILRYLRSVIAWLKPADLAPFYGDAPGVGVSLPPSASEFYTEIERERGRDPVACRTLVEGCELPDMPQLLPKLRPYQQAAVRFMLSREHGNGEGGSDGGISSGSHGDSSNADGRPRARSLDAATTAAMGWVALPLLRAGGPLQGGPSNGKGRAGGSWVYYNPLTGCLCQKLPEEELPQRNNPSGGILADEMGLGKTVEVLGCILGHRKPPRDCSTTPSSNGCDHQDAATATANGAGGKDAWSNAASAASPKGVVPAAAAANGRASRANGNGYPTAPLSLKYGGAAAAAAAAAVTSPLRASKRLRVAHSSGKLRRSGGGSDQSDGGDPEAEGDNIEIKDETEDGGQESEEEEWAESREKTPRRARPDPSPSPPRSGRGRKRPLQSTSAYWDNPQPKAVLGTACLCRNDRESEKVNCKVCGRWLHARCAGFDSDDEDDDRDDEGGTTGGRGDYTCVACRCRQCLQQPLGSGATLIVCPPVILGQWKEEIAKHTMDGALKVLEYPGLKSVLQRVEQAAGPRTKQQVADVLQLMSPDYLAAHDIVLTTFDALRTDLNHVTSAFATGGVNDGSDNNADTLSLDAKNGGNGSPGTPRSRTSMRFVKRYEAVPSALPAVKWWRVVLDEAQMVEATTQDTAQMAMRLPAVHRWCVSGTPLGKGGIEDLHGLLLFLQVEPYCRKGIWQHAMLAPVEARRPGAMARLMTALRGLLWRTAKRDVADQLGLPPQQDTVRRLRFSSVEMYFYKKQHRDTTAQAKKVLRDRAARDLKNLGPALRKLRQACCHPQVGGGVGTGAAATGGAAASGAVLSMDEIHDRLIVDARLKCLEAQRKVLMNMNALAGIARAKAELAGGDMANGGGGGASGSGGGGANTGSSGGGINDPLLRKSRHLAEAARLYELAMEKGQQNHAIGAVTGKFDVVGPPTLLSAGAVQAGEPLRLRWELPASPAAAAAAAASAAPAAAAVVVHPRELETWARLDFAKPKRLAQLRMQLLPPDKDDETGEASPVLCWPTECLLEATDTVGASYVQVHRFSLPPPTPAAPAVAQTVSSASAAGAIAAAPTLSREWRTTSFEANQRARSYRLTILNAEPIDSQLGGSGGGGVRKRMVSLEVELSEMEMEVDPLVQLHIAVNWREVLQMREKIEKEARPVSSKGSSGAGGDSDGGSSSGAPHIARPEAAAAAVAAATAATAETPPSSPLSPAAASSPTSSPLGSPASPVARPATPSWSLTARGAAVAAKCSELESTAEAVRRMYVGPRYSDRKVADLQLRAAVKACEEFRRTAEEARASAGSKVDGGAIWWDHALQAIEADKGESATLLERARFEATVEKEHGRAGVRHQRNFPQFTNLRGLRLALTLKLKEMDAARTKGLKVAQEMREEPTEPEILENHNCGKCRRDWGCNGPACRNCRREAPIDAFEQAVWPSRREGRDADGSGRGRASPPPDEDGILFDKGHYNAGSANARQGIAFREDSTVIRILRHVLRWSLARARAAPDNKAWVARAKEADAFMKAWDVTKEEVLEVRKLWRNQAYLLDAIDEVSAATTPLQLLDDDAPVEHLNEQQRNAVILPMELEARRVDYENQKALAEAELKECWHQLTYLRNLHTERRLLAHEADCPVCHDQLGEEVAVLECGHSFCEAHARDMTKNHRLRCPTCRQMSPVTNVYLASSLSSKDGTAATVDVKGSWGTKVSALVSDIWRLAPGTKALVFSQWNEMLDIVGMALERNNISHVRIRGTSSVSKAIKAFRDNEDVGVLMLPVRAGAKGLTLVSATHVFMLEPLMSAADDAQAINRVHRIGQTQPTFVHRYVVSGTVEERVYDLCARKTQSAGGTDALLGSGARSSRAGGGPQDEVSIDDVQELFAAEAAVDADGEDNVGGGSAGSGGSTGGHGSGSAMSEIETEREGEAEPGAAAASGAAAAPGAPTGAGAARAAAAAPAGRKRRSPRKATGIAPELERLLPKA